MISTLRRTVKNTAYNYSQVTVKTREATSNAPALPTDDELKFLAAQTHDSLRFVEMMCVLWKRLCDSPKCWRHVYKSLIVLEHLLIHGNATVIEQCHANQYILGRLANFQLYDNGVDHGLVVREVVARVLALLNSPEKLEERRKEAADKKQRRTSTPASSASNSVNVANQSSKPVRSELLATAPKNEEEESAQLQLVIALSHQTATKNKRSSNQFGIQSALDFASRDQSALDDELFAPECPPSSPAVFDFPVNQQVTTAAEECQTLIDVSSFVPINTVEPPKPAPQSTDPLAWIGDYNNTALIPTVQASNPAQWNPFGTTVQSNPFST
ncbi:ENTH domain-containing protein [Aphelenchoides besseyi]|nr:ENTH domain-containing protein [Aphelenchoides besseyi]KAI6224027.1 ENTH domain-containing protein [Aphelenchoides besseyi]